MNVLNFNLGRPKLSYDRLLSQMSNLGRVEPINLIGAKLKAILAGQYSKKFSPERG